MWPQTEYTVVPIHSSGHKQYTCSPNSLSGATNSTRVTHEVRSYGLRQPINARTVARVIF